ncbi:NUMOD3 domain-containing DNA-binding protein [Neorhizobium sp. T7_12]|uniref:NUMOD3 domain-containing DNA-binding protein n=1 Tax=Neorhizobium sp. T7_12 TaxID=2093832 RepID=UPI000CF8D609|nr:NUMOD3 domain-containing DNA-binding protein [Neorhizobium sp. T7_12]
MTIRISPQQVLAAITAPRSGRSISAELREILEIKYDASRRYQTSRNKVQFDLTLEEYIGLMTPWQLAQMEKKLATGNLRKFMGSDFGYVLGWKDKAGKASGIMNAETAVFCNRETSKRNLQLKKGDKQTEAGKAKIAKARTGTKHSAETKAAISKTKKGVALTDEHKAALSVAKKGRKMSDAHKAAIAVAQAARHAARKAVKEAGNV